jgi:hypothetical protein
MKTAFICSFCFSLLADFNPIADTDTQSDTSAGTNANISVTAGTALIV